MLTIFGVLSVLWNVFLVIVVVVVAHYFYLISNFNYWKKKGVFSPNPLALFGDLPGQINGKTHISKDLEDLYKKYKNTHSHIGIFNFRSPRLLIFDPGMIRDILIKYFRNFQATEFYGKIDQKSDPLFGNHMFFLIGDEWKTKRQEVTPAFTNSRIKAVTPIMEKVYEKMDNYIRNESKKSNFEGFEAKDLCARYAISIVSNSIYNVDPKTFEGGESEIQKLAQSFLTPSKRMLFFMTLYSVYPFINKFIKFGFAKDDAEQFFFDLMSNSMRQREESNFKQIDYLDHLITLKNRKEITDSDIACHGALFLVDGFDTSSGAIAGALYELAKNPQIQRKLREEINRQMPNKEDFNYDNIMNLEYLDSVWNESLRLHYVVAHFARTCVEPVEIEFPKGKRVKFDVGDTVYLPVYEIFRDPEYFEKPLEFNPDRFSEENGGVKAFMDRGTFFPFGNGPRNCPGGRFANAQGKFCLASLIKNFEVTLGEKTGNVEAIHPQSIIMYVVNCYLKFNPINEE